jgi:hypothetical protein
MTLDKNQEKNMSIRSVKAEIRNALKNDRISKPEAKKIIQEADKDGRVSQGEYNAILDVYNHRMTNAASREFLNFFTRNTTGVGTVTSQSVDEEDGGFGAITTQRVGEEENGI